MSDADGGARRRRWWWPPERVTQRRGSFLSGQASGMGMELGIQS